MKNIHPIIDLISHELRDMPLNEKVEAINEIRSAIHKESPFSSEPVDFVRWVPVDVVTANDYNPNSVAPPEMELLRKSINNDGYTQPVVTWNNDKDIREVIDGFHRTRVCKEVEDIQNRLHGFLPVVTVNDTCTSRNDRMASTIRHNRARGKHNVTAMSDIVTELKNRNWKNSRIAKELGMDEDEVLRLCQITGLGTLFEDRDFSKSWESSDYVDMDDFEPLTDEFDDDSEKGRTANTSDENRKFHTFDKWECVAYNFYGTKKEGMTKDDCEQSYKNFLSSPTVFEHGLKLVISEWKHSCEHYLTNRAMNRIAWLGQAAMARIHEVPSKFCAGFNLLTEEQKNQANELALRYLNKWLSQNGMDAVEMDEALSIGRQVEIY